MNETDSVVIFRQASDWIRRVQADVLSGSACQRIRKQAPERRPEQASRLPSCQRPTAPAGCSGLPEGDCAWAAATTG